MHLHHRLHPARAAGAVAIAACAVLTPALAQAAGASPGRAAANVATCTRADVRSAVHTDRRHYAPGEAVRITVVATNVSGHDCAPPPMVHVAVRSASGDVVWRSGVGILWTPEAVWHPGQSLRWRFVWHQEDCSADTCSTPVPPGAYVATGAWDGYRQASARFSVG
jgi:hypothetical protein